MTLAIMQPYLFPYIGYFQLMRAVDCFVSHDDVQYIKGGWINRNRILVNGAPVWITLPVSSASAYALINERNYSDVARSQSSIVRKLRSVYAKAPYCRDTIALVEACMDCNDANVATFNLHCLRVIADALHIECRFESASRMDFDKGLKAQDRVLMICKHLGAECYINPIGGLGLYDDSAFTNAGISLRFLSTEFVPYSQFAGEHVASLSIIDVLMFNSIDKVRTMLDSYKLVTHNS